MAKRTTGKKSKVWLITSIMLLLILIVGGIGVWYYQNVYSKLSPVADFSTVSGKFYLSEEIYRGEEVTSFNHVKWEKTDTKLSFSPIDQSNIFIGTYVDNKLFTGRIMATIKQKNNYLGLKQTSFIVSADYYNSKLKKEEQTFFEKLDNSDIPDLINSKDTYYISKTFHINSEIKSYKFYLKDKELIRENVPDNDSYYYMKYEQQ
ncbi:hypothetical protein PF023_07985 [Enterococcus thailandicus]|uniref:hypothetical protein n=1 Tax=Enterococcus thailandicus TaxID=417368 RepID=UPI0022EBA5DA|nr:hypothetical protein [Enterococcus thailandicus]MDA3973981.1 hypothetical protein [Enterococcus thailandicus]MDA3976209.1 hypothetical protein [Enterococcus thailandicus]MDA3981174.1 hypothetical protein [Enterococcus thailandicus]